MDFPIELKERMRAEWSHIVMGRDIAFMCLSLSNEKHEYFGGHC